MPDSFLELPNPARSRHSPKKKPISVAAKKRAA